MKFKYYIKNVKGLVFPARANKTDAGYDVIATSGPKIVGDVYSGTSYKRIDYIEYETNLYTHPATEAIDSCQSSYSIYNCHTDLRPRSSISKYNIVLANSVGLIDRGYRNQILVRFKYIWQPEDYSIIDDLESEISEITESATEGADETCDGEYYHESLDSSKINFF